MYMKIAENRLRKLCAKKGFTIRALLEQSGVSKNAFYTLARKNSILPRSITAIADILNVSPSEFLEDSLPATQRAQQLLAKIDRIAKCHKTVDRDNIRHTLQLLNEKPINRLRRALRRAQKFNFQ